MPLHTSSLVDSKGRSNIIGRILCRLALGASALSFIAGLFVVNFQAQALTGEIITKLQGAGVPAWGAGAKTDVAAIVGSIILTVLGLLGVVFVILLTYGGFLWLTSAGEEEKTKKATGLIFNSIIGVFIVIAAYAIAYFVLQKLAAAV